MAVTPPTPPTPPKPPEVPPVTLQGGGLEQDSTAPAVSKSSDPESQARDAVARGDGALSKTVTGKPGESSENQEQQSASQQASSGNRTPAAAAQPEASSPEAVTQTVQAAQPLPLLDAESLLREPQEKGADARQQGTQAETQIPAGKSPLPSTGYGPIFWTVTLIVLAACGVVFFRFIRKKGGIGRLKKTGTSGGKPKPDMNLTGQTAEEVLRALQAQQMAQARAAAPEKAKGNAGSAAKRAAKQYQAPADKMSPETDVPREEPPKVIRRNPKPDQEESHFEVRI